MISDLHALCPSCGSATQLDQSLLDRATQPEAWPVCPCGDLFALPSLEDVDRLNGKFRELVCGTVADGGVR